LLGGVGAVVKFEAKVLTFQVEKKCFVVDLGFFELLHHLFQRFKIFGVPSKASKMSFCSGNFLNSN
jgi:hypothetical protein